MRLQLARGLHCRIRRIYGLRRERPHEPGIQEFMLAGGKLSEHVITARDPVPTQLEIRLASLASYAVLTEDAFLRLNVPGN